MAYIEMQAYKVDAVNLKNAVRENKNNAAGAG